ncbi:MAG: hypothetical protein ACRCW0_02025 [Clostridium sp.]
MVKVYTSYKCVGCKKEFVLLTQTVENFKGYLTCPYCNNRKIKELEMSDSLKECMSERSYKKVNGVIRQVR